MSPRRPHLIMIAGPNGAGKTTTAPELLRGHVGVTEFVNADLIARGISGFAGRDANIEAGRIMMRRIRELADRKMSFAFETTLAARTFAPKIMRLRELNGYSVDLNFLWLPDEQQAVERVRERVRLGGHPIPEETIRRRYSAGLRNFFSLYLPIADHWVMYDNSRDGGPAFIAGGTCGRTDRIGNERMWNSICARWREAET